MHHRKHNCEWNPCVLTEKGKTNPHYNNAGFIVAENGQVLIMQPLYIDNIFNQILTDSCSI